MIRDEVDKAVRAAVTQENAPINKELESINAKLAQANAVRFVTSSPDTVSGLEGATLAKVLRTPSKGDWEVTSVSELPTIYDPSRSEPLKTKMVSIRMKNGKTVTLTSDDADTLELAKEKLSTR